MEEQKASHEESLIIIDAYRIAFEEQLSRNGALMRQLAEITSCSSQPTRAQKAKAAVSWLISQLNEECAYPVPSRLPDTFGPPLPTPSSEKPQEPKEQDLIQSLVDVINDRSEALAHQRLAARMLASQNSELQKKLSQADTGQVDNGK